MSGTVDLRSDTVTRPTAPMRAAMAAAEVGDDVYGEDPTVNALQDHAAELFDREAALFVPSGVMANVVSVKVLTDPGDEVVVERFGHSVAYEDGAPAAIAGVQYLTVEGDRGRLSAEAIDAAWRPAGWPYPTTALVSVEETTNRGGGAIYGLERLRAIRDLLDTRGTALHLDGARIFNAIVASGVAPADYGPVPTSLNFCLSKGLGAPVGSMIVGDADFVDEARRWRRRLGGAMRQVGVLAAAGRYALDHHVDRLADDHANARLLADQLADRVPGSADPALVDTNIVFVDTGDHDAPTVAERAAERGVLFGPADAHTLRLVTSLEVDRAGAERAAHVIADLVA
ncbi:threonine aldolase family protein [Salsipaludibacter albus]|uniref:threonine aldolase family protein n=1 Tax=Salsipaludibacter albus TaxID=2849650 RepID=UPI001EE4E9CB|nr:GntG family PLP-dependent aldolase [Salsipaludibacter albus]MBY5164302.1 low specificity L-threonine aldolase [Salsipaludibacter albus]